MVERISMTDKPEISIIIPVYNSEKYLGNTLESILCQSFKKFEIILVDDGSSDGSEIICDEYSAKDERINVIHQKNGGICAARNRGLKAARGKYIAFCDNDDIYLQDLLKDNYELAEKHNADVVRFSRKYVVYKNGKKVFEEDNIFSEGVFSGDEVRKNFNEINRSGEGIWAGIYKRDFLVENNMCFDESMRYGYEDLYFTTQLYMNNPKIVLNPKVYYCWLMRYEHSTTGKVNINNINSLIKCLKLKRKYLKDMDIDSLFPELWISELARRIFTVVRYVSPVKVKMSLRKRIGVIRYFRKADVFKEKLNRAAKHNLFKKSKADWIVYTLFNLKLYYILYLLVTLKQRTSEK